MTEFYLLLRFSLVLFAVVGLLATVPAVTGSGGRTRSSLDRGWRFALGHATNPKKDFDPSPAGTSFSYFAKAGTAAGAAKSKFDDRKWEVVDLPHDWAVALPFSEKGSHSHGYKALGSNFPENSVGWYRRVVEVPAEDQGKRISIEFNGVFRDSQVWFNGFYLGREQSGYSSFAFDVSDYVNFGGSNVLVVRVDASLEEGWWYEGAGIYRHVWLTKTAPVHVAQHGTYVTTTLRGSAAKVSVQTTIENDLDAVAQVQVVQSVLGPDGKVVSESRAKAVKLGPGGTAVVSESLPVPDANLWSVETPALYSLMTRVLQDGAEVDRYETPFGIRTIKWDPKRGFMLNGQRVQIQGVNNHADHAGVGTAVPDALDVWRLKQLKKMGVNAIRMSHNPASPVLMDLCDRMGFLVVAENRETGVSAHQLDGLGRLILRDRNHPCVVLWSLGNEEWAIEGNERGARITSRMQAVAHALDPTRPATVAISGGWGGGSSTVVDVMGFNYITHGSTDDFHKQFPKTSGVGTEDGAGFTTRGVYVEDRAKGHLTAYDIHKADWNVLARDSWQHYAARPYLAGQFQWTGFDYRGEPTPFGWPNIASQFGILDLCGFPKDNFYFYQAWWSGKPVLHVLPHWNWAGREGQVIDVWVYSNCDEVELFLNDASLGRHRMPRNGRLEWKVPYVVGRLVARGFVDGNETMVREVATTGPAAGVSVKPEYEGDLAIVAVSSVDAEGRFAATGDGLVQFEVLGPARIIGVGNGDPSSLEADKSVETKWGRRLFGGLAQVIVQRTAGTGEVVLKVSAHLGVPARAVVSEHRLAFGEGQPL